MAAPQFRVAVDVQHLYRGSHPSDQGSVYTITGGVRVTEASATTIYAAAIRHQLEAAGVAVLSNDPARQTLVGEYWTRNRAARAWGANLYLACHLNAGGGRYASLEMMEGCADSALCGALSSNLATYPLAIHDCRFPILRRGQRGAVCIESFHGPAVLLEPFFGDNPDSQRLLSGAMLAELGAAIAKGALMWWSARPAVAIPT